MLIWCCCFMTSVRGYISVLCLCNLVLVATILFLKRRNEEKNIGKCTVQLRRPLMHYHGNILVLQLEESPLLHNLVILYFYMMQVFRQLLCAAQNLILKKKKGRAYHIRPSIEPCYFNMCF